MQRMQAGQHKNHALAAAERHASSGLAAEETLIHLHIPKTAGISLSRLIVRQFREEQVYHIRDGKHSSAPIYGSHHGPEEDFKQLSDERKLSYRCVVGHMHYGLHREISGSCRYVTLVRDPVERVLSQYGQYQRMVESNEMGPGEKSMPLDEYCRVKSRAADNQQVRFLCGRAFDKHPRQENLELAKEHLRSHFLLVGTLERFDEAVLALYRTCNWGDPPAVKENVGSHRPQQEAVDKHFLRWLEDNNPLDRDLHSLANSLLDQTIDRLGRGQFERDLAALRQQWAEQGPLDAAAEAAHASPAISQAAPTGKFLSLMRRLGNRLRGRAPAETAGKRT